MSDLFDRARASIKVEALAAKLVKLRAHGNAEVRGTCPICGASPSSGSVFKIDLVKQTWRCFACDRFGDVVDLHAATTNLTLAEAARDLAGPAPTSGVAKVREETPDDGDRMARILRMAADMISQARPIVGTLGAAYLVGRAIEPALIDQLDAPLFHPAAPHSWNPEARVWRTAPAIVLRIVTPGGGTGGAHVTYLDPAGGKSKLDPAKRMWGPQGEETGLGRRRGGAWLVSAFPDDGDLVIGEGMESALSLASWLWRGGRRDFGVCAALSLNGLQGGLQRDSDGAVDVYDPKGDPASPPFSWPPCYTAPGQQPPRALIAIDRDMSPIRLKGRTGRGRLVDYELDAEARAKLCARLSKAAWQSIGWKASALFPRPNGDWNDTLRSAAQTPAYGGRA